MKNYFKSILTCYNVFLKLGSIERSQATKLYYYDVIDVLLSNL
jgi:hypothetical protein